MGEITNVVTDFVASGSFASLRENVKYYNEPNYAVLVRTKDFQTNFTKELVFTDKHGYEFLGNSNLFGGEIILPNIGASIGKIFTVPHLSQRMTLAPNSIMVKFSDELLKEWFFFVFSSEFGKQTLFIISNSTAQGKFNKTDFKEVLIPLPPIAEQRRIVAEIERWFGLIDRIERSKSDLQTAIKQTKTKVLDLAIHGQLVPQDPTDEPAIELLRRINPDFAPCDIGHYPKGWCQIKLSQICTTINGLWKGKKEPFAQVGVIRNANFTKDFQLNYSNIEVLEVEKRAFAGRNLQNEDLIVEKSGGSDNYPVGRTILYKGESGIYSFSNFTMVVRLCNKTELSPTFVYFCLLSMYLRGDMKAMQTQTTGLHNLITEKYLSIAIPIPPIAEQHRIEERIEEVFGMLDHMEKSLQA